MIVVDTNVIAYTVLNGEFSAACSRLYFTDSQWLSPRLWRDEFANVLATYERNGLLNREEALLAFQDAEALVQGNEFDVRIERILSVAKQTKCSAYDAQYLALAEDLGVFLYTFDRKVLRQAPTLAKKPAK